MPNEKIEPTLTERPVQRFRRYATECPGFLVMPATNKTVALSTADVSREGFKATVVGKIFFGSRMMVSLSLGDFRVANLVARPVWANAENQVGFQIEQASANWTDFVTALETA